MLGHDGRAPGRGFEHRDRARVVRARAGRHFPRIRRARERFPGALLPARFGAVEREAQLLFIGEQFRRAIESYYESTPGGAKQFPRTLEDLVEDRRLPTTKRHLRRLFRDPMTGSTEWGVLRLGPENTIVGVHNLSKEPPIKRAGFGIGRESFANTQQYVDWEFRFVPGMTGAAAPSGTAPPRAP